MGKTMSKINLILIMVLSLTLIGVATFTVYSAIQSSVTLSNKIRFNAEGVYFNADILVYNANDMKTPVIDGHYNKEGTPEDSQGDFAFSRAIDFEKDLATSFVYVIKIRNYSEFPISASITLSANSADVHEYVRNEINAPNVTIGEYKYGETPPSGELKLTSTCISFMKSFQFNNGFIINLTQK